MGGARRQVRWFGYLMGLLATVCTVQGMAADVRNLRMWHADGNTRLVFDLSGPVRYGLFSLSGPDRIVLDLDNSKLMTRLDRLSLKGTPIKDIRYGTPTAGKLRVVIDLASRVNPNSFLLSPNKEFGNRLVIDLKEQGTVAPAGNPNVAPAHGPTMVASSARPAPVASSLTATAVTAVAAPARAPVTQSRPVARLADAPRPNPNTKVSLLRPQGRDILVMIDPGHGGKDPGATGKHGEHEKDVTLAIGRRLKALIDAKKGYRAELTRNGDYFIPLRGRTEIARRKHADLFISIHADASPNGVASGASVFALSNRGATSETARWLANTENNSDLIGGKGDLSLNDKDQALASVLLDLSMTASMASSLNVGQQVLSNIGQVSDLHGRRVEQAGFVVLKSPDIPSILVETGFITTPRESARLFNPSYQQTLARSIFGGVQSYFAQNPPQGTYIAALRDAGKLAMDDQSKAWRNDDF